jgi:hypothetical protein
MFWFCSALSAAGVLEPVICSCLVAEFAGYWLHGLLHSHKLPLLIRGYLAHQLLRYGPLQAMLGDGHNDARRVRFSPFDRIFRTRLTRRHSLNQKSLAMALLRYRLTTPLHRLGSDSIGGGKAAFQ